MRWRPRGPSKSLPHLWRELGDRERYRHTSVSGLRFEIQSWYLLVFRSGKGVRSFGPNSLSGNIQPTECVWFNAPPFRTADKYIQSSVSSSYPVKRTRSIAKFTMGPRASENYSQAQRRRRRGRCASVSFQKTYIRKLWWTRQWVFCERMLSRTPHHMFVNDHFSHLPWYWPGGGSRAMVQ